jgi:hypothetical protein
VLLTKELRVDWCGDLSQGTSHQDGEGDEAQIGRNEGGERGIADQASKRILEKTLTMTWLDSCFSDDEVIIWCMHLWDRNT